MFDKVRVFLKLWDLEKQAVRRVQVGNDIKPGWKTTEFWLTVLMQAPAIVGIFLGASNPITIGIGAACVIAYNLARTTNKVKVAKAVILAGAQAGADAAQTEQATIAASAAPTVVVVPKP